MNQFNLQNFLPDLVYQTTIVALPHGQTETHYQLGQLVFLIMHEHTLELRTDPSLALNLSSQYESIMLSRYFGKAGIELVFPSQLSSDQLADLLRLSVQLTQQKAQSVSD